MSRTSLHRPRRHRAVWDRRVTDTRLLPKSSPLTLSPGIPLSGDGRFKEYMRHTLSKGLCRIGAPLTGRSGFAHGEFKEPAFAGLRLRVVVPLQDPTAVTIRVIPSADRGIGSVLPSLSSVERCCRTDRPHTETPSNLARLLRHVWGFRRIAADLLGVGAGVVVFLRNSHGPSIASHPHPQQTKPKLNQRRHPAPFSFRGSERNLERGIPLLGDGPLIPSQIRRGESPVEWSSGEVPPSYPHPRKGPPTSPYPYLFLVAGVLTPGRQPKFSSRSITQARAFDCNNQKAFKS